MRKSDETYDEAVRLWPALLDRVKNGMQSSAAPLFCASIAEYFDDVAIQVTNVIPRIPLRR